MRLPVVFPGMASIACLLAVSPAAGQAETAFARASSSLLDFQKLTSLLLPPAFGQDNQVRAPMLIANEVRPESRDRLAQPSARPESRDRLARPVSELPAYRPESRDPLARSYEDVRKARPELLDSGSKAVALAQDVAPANESAATAPSMNSADGPPVPIALSAVPMGAGPAGPTLQRTQGKAEGLGLAQYLSAPWQQIGFIAGLVLLASLLFWRLGMRGRQGPLALTDYGRAERSSAREEGDRARYPTLREAIEAMKAEAATRR
ncbi:hypothetical protein [Sphingobium xanthum]|uniref:hypothetical protein n=1 Tax=Sphingobium xanthum TaxID=1387165 RepID=UPI0015EBC6CC|nr:hypothetical protein [Sphingobium xanthum]MCW2362005.1 hypothetical protein [Sphingobium sp. B10D3B]MCW2401316.1 hypothetical protein [Sphingobium sp. B10D7B]MCW2408296.1 hypothetical protein [Sphingobium xanthum]